MARTPSQPTAPSAATAALVPHGRFKGKPAMPLTRPVTVIGARSRSHLHLVSSQISKSHAIVVNTGSGFYIRDLASRTHVLVNGQQVQEADLKDGDVVGVGPFTFKFTDSAGKKSTKKAEPAPPGVLRVEEMPLPLPLEGRVTVIGRRGNCDVVVDGMEVSTTHAVVFELAGKRYIRDLGSRTGTFVNGTAVHQQSIEFGDTIKIGESEMTYAEAAEELEGIGTELPDVTEDLAGTARLSAVEETPLDLVFEEPKTPPRSAASARPASPLPLEPAAGDNGELAEAIPLEPAAEELDLSLEPAIDVTPEPIAPAAEVEIPAVAPPEHVETELTPPAPHEPVTTESGVESALGIELLPHDEHAATAPAESQTAPPAPAESDFGLKFASEPPPADTLGAAAAELAPGELHVPSAEVPSAPAQPIAEAPATAEPRKPAMWRRLFGRKKEEAEELAPSADLAPPAPAPAAPPALPEVSAPLDLEPASEAPALDDLPPEPTELDLAALEVGSAAPTELEMPGDSFAGVVAPDEDISAPAPAAPAEELPVAKVVERAGVDLTKQVEVVEKTEPTPESALALDAAIAEAPQPLAPPPVVSPAPSAEALTDSVFGREVEAFEGPGLGPIVEEPPAASSAAAEIEQAPAEDLIFEDVPPTAVADEKAIVEVTTEPSEAPAEEAAAEPPKRRGRKPAAGKPAAPKGRRTAASKRKPPVEAPAEEVPAEMPAPEPVAIESAPPAAEQAFLSTSEVVPAAIPEAAETSEVVGAGVIELGIEEPEPATAADPLVFDESASTPPAESSPAAAQLPPPATVDEVPSAPSDKPVDLFFGLERDTASFLGGMPLQLPPLASPFAQTHVDFSQPVRSAPAPRKEEKPPVPAAEEVEPPSEFGGAFEDVESLPPAPPEFVSGEAPGATVVPAVPPIPTAPSRPQTTYPAPPPPARSVGRDRSGDRAAPGSPAQPARPAASSPFDLNFGDVPTDRIQIPPFAGPGPSTRGQVTTAFDGLAMPPVREADVFSHVGFGGGGGGAAEPVIPPFGGAASASDQRDGDDDKFPADDHDDEEPLDLTSVEDDEDSATATAGVGPGPMSSAVPQEPSSEVSSESRRARPATTPQRRPPAYPTDPGGAPQQQPKKKRWRIGKWGLFGLMLVSMLGTSGCIWVAWPKLFPSAAQITASIKFANLDKVSDERRKEVLRDQHDKLTKPELRTLARQILEKNHGTASAGFLRETGTTDEVASAAKTYLKLTEDLKLADKKDYILLKHSAVQGEDDRYRVQALLEALYAENLPMIDAAGQAASAYDTKKNELVLQTERLNTDVLPAVGAARKELGGAPQEVVAKKRHEIDSLQQKDKQLTAAWNETMANVRSLTADVRAAESSVPFDPDADPAKAAPIPADDPQVAELTKRTEELATKLAATKQKRTAKSDEARKALAAALKQFEEDVAKARSSLKADSELGRYLDAAARVQSQLKVVSGELAQQQRSDMERLSMLKRKLNDKNEARIRQAFANDTDLSSLQQTLALKERQYNAALASGLKDDAKALEKEIKGLKVEVESRQDLLTTADGVAPDIKELEDFINETLARMESDRGRNDRRMAEMLKELASQAPAAGSLPAEQKAFAEQLEKRQAELNKARERWSAAADAAAAEADQDVKDLETELASAQVKVDERKKQVAEASRKTLSEAQQKARAAMTEARRKDLDRATAADQVAADTYRANRKALADATDELERLKKRIENFDRENHKATAMQRSMKDLSDEVERLSQRKAAAVIPVKPSDDDIAYVADAHDLRLNYILGTIVMLGLVFVPLMLAAPSHVHAGSDHENDEAHSIANFPLSPALYGAHSHGDSAMGNVPFAAPSPQNVDAPAAAAAQAVEDATAENARTPGAQSPIPV